MVAIQSIFAILVICFLFTFNFLFLILAFAFLFISFALTKGKNSEDKNTDLGNFLKSAVFGVSFSTPVIILVVVGLFLLGMSYLQIGDAVTCMTLKYIGIFVVGFAFIAVIFKTLKK